MRDTWTKPQKTSWNPTVAGTDVSWGIVTAKKIKNQRLTFLIRKRTWLFYLFGVADVQHYAVYQWSGVYVYVSISQCSKYWTIHPTFLFVCHEAHVFVVQLFTIKRRYYRPLGKCSWPMLDSWSRLIHVDSPCSKCDIRWSSLFHVCYSKGELQEYTLHWFNGTSGNRTMVFTYQI